MRILLVEDDTELGALVLRYLQKHYQIEWVQEFDEAKYRLNEIKYDLVLLDRNLHGNDCGLELLTLTHAKNCKTIVLSAYGTVKDKIHGLDSGADDYLEKPFEPEELRARIDALLRRDSTDFLYFDDMNIDMQQQSIIFNDEPVILSKKEHALLFYLLSRVNEIVSKSDILQTLYTHPDEITSNTIDATIAHIRKKLPINIIKTIKTRGVMVEYLTT